MMRRRLLFMAAISLLSGVSSSAALTVKPREKAQRMVRRDFSFIDVGCVLVSRRKRMPRAKE